MVEYHIDRDRKREAIQTNTDNDAESPSTLRRRVAYHIDPDRKREAIQTNTDKGGLRII